MDTGAQLWVQKAKAPGPLEAGHYRVVVIESDLENTHLDFADLDEAKRYADDAASETDDNPPVARVFDDAFEVVHRGRPYYAG